VTSDEGALFVAANRLILARPEGLSGLRQISGRLGGRARGRRAAHFSRIEILERGEPDDDDLRLVIMLGSRRGLAVVRSAHPLARLVRFHAKAVGVEGPPHGRRIDCANGVFAFPVPCEIAPDLWPGLFPPPPTGRTGYDRTS